MSEGFRYYCVIIEIGALLMIYAFSLCSVGRAGINASTGRTMEDKANDLVTWSDKAKKVEQESK